MHFSKGKLKEEWDKILRKCVEYYYDNNVSAHNVYVQTVFYGLCLIIKYVLSYLINVSIVLVFMHKDRIMRLLIFLQEPPSVTLAALVVQLVMQYAAVMASVTSAPTIASSARQTTAHQPRVTTTATVPVDLRTRLWIKPAPPAPSTATLAT